MEERSNLYHCTKIDSLIEILKSRQFNPSFCLEGFSVLPDKEFRNAYAVVCFADMTFSEMQKHMDRFKADSYLRMKKSWALKNYLSPVIYYKDKSLLSNLLKNVLLHASEDEIRNNQKHVLFEKSVWMLMAFLKEYEGKYYIKKKNDFSKETTQFYQEREWRYVPIPQDYEAFYMTEDDYKKEALRKEKETELLEHGYALNFDWKDIEEIGIPEKYKDYLKDLIPDNWVKEKGETNRIRLL